MNTLKPSETPRDVENDGSRFWSTDTAHQPFGVHTVGVVDENEGGIVLYCHEDNAEAIIGAFRAATGEI